MKTVRLAIMRYNDRFTLERNCGGQAWITIKEGDSFNELYDWAEDVFDGNMIIWS